MALNGEPANNSSDSISQTALFGTAWNLEVLQSGQIYDFWITKLVLIFLGYGTVIGPGYFLVKTVEKWWNTNPSRFQRNLFLNFLRHFAVGQPEYQLTLSEDTVHKEQVKSRESLASRAVLLCFYSIGIQLTLVCMGVYQERIMTQGYPRIDGTGPEKYSDAQYLVFANRLVALVLVICYLIVNWHRQPPHVPPFYSHSFISISNTLSSWCQYEALKYVSFPTQTVCKASKVVPTMLMGRVLRGEKYSSFDYLMALMLAFGASMFVLSSVNYDQADVGDGAYILGVVSGIFLMVGYLGFDAFTLNWQKKLFDTKPKVSSHQMMLGVNGFSAILCLVSLLEQGTLWTSTAFILEHTGIACDVFILSLSGACGQLFIYVTIQQFGPVIFTVIMTVRQMLSILVSTLHFNHAFNVFGALGLLIAFGSIFFNVYAKYLKLKVKTQALT